MHNERHAFERAHTNQHQPLRHRTQTQHTHRHAQINIQSHTQSYLDDERAGCLCVALLLEVVKDIGVQSVHVVSECVFVHNSNAHSRTLAKLGCYTALYTATQNRPVYVVWGHRQRVGGGVECRWAASRRRTRLTATLNKDTRHITYTRTHNKWRHTYICSVSPPDRLPSADIAAGE